MERFYSPEDDLAYLMAEFDRSNFQFGMAILDREWPRDLFQKLDAVTVAIAEKLKAGDTLPRAFLRDLHSSVKQATNQLPYVRDHKEQAAEGVSRLALTFDLIIAGESHGDRQPGVPRIV